VADEVVGVAVAVRAAPSGEEQPEGPIELPQDRAVGPDIPEPADAGVVVGVVQPADGTAVGKRYPIGGRGDAELAAVIVRLLAGKG
jgi:hypothetical protein